MANKIDQLVGARTRLIRIDRGLSQQAVASAVGVTFQQIQKYEKGANRISASTLVALCRLFKANITDFFVDVDDFEKISSNEVMSIYDDPQVIQMARAFSTIPSESARSKLLNLINVMADG